MTVEVDLFVNYRLADGVLYKKINDESVLLDTNNGQYYGLNAVGSRFWELCTHGTSIEDVMTILMNEFEVDANRLNVDITALMQDMLGKELVVAVKSD